MTFEFATGDVFFAGAAAFSCSLVTFGGFAVFGSDIASGLGSSFAGCVAGRAGG
jgi:hypothetical protein